MPSAGNLYLLAQGEGSRWHSTVSRVGLPEQPPEFKQLCRLGPETLIGRSARLFEAAGFDVTVVAGADLWKAALLLSPMPDCLTLLHPGTDVLEGVRSLMEIDAPSGPVVIALGDVLFSRKAVRSIWRSVHFAQTGVMARTIPNPVSLKDTEEVFACWFSPLTWPAVLERINTVLFGGAAIPRKPWGFPLVGLPNQDKVRRAYLTGAGLEAIGEDLILSDDYTDDTDNIDEWNRFWPSLRSAALADE